MSADRIPVVSREQRRALATGQDRSPAAHQRAFDDLGAFDQVEVGGAPSRPDPTGELRVAAANLERGIWLEPLVEVLASTDADVLLLSELDDGMARSGGRHVAEEVANALGATYAFAVEFVELAAPDGDDRGLHGGAVVSRVPIHDPRVVRLTVDGAWFDGHRPGAEGEPRVGGRIAVMATVVVDRTPITVAAPHLESHGSPQGRARELDVLLAAVERRDPGGAAVIAGDLNTHTLGPEHFTDPAAMARALADGAGRFTHPTNREPLFALAADAGYAWQEANVLDTPTARVDHSLPPTMHLDWMLTRGLDATAAAVVPSVGDDGVVASDHDVIVASLRPGSRPPPG